MYRKNDRLITYYERIYEENKGEKLIIHATKRKEILKQTRTNKEGEKIPTSSAIEENLNI